MTMLSRRTLLGSSAGLAVAGALPAVTVTPPARPDLFIGTGGDGHTFPGATMPFGISIRCRLPMICRCRTWAGMTSNPRAMADCFVG